MFNLFKSKQYDIDAFYRKVEEKSWGNIDQAEFVEVSRAMNNIFNGGDAILEKLSKKDLIQKLDVISRAMTHCKIDKNNKHYIYSNIYKAKEGIDSISRKQLFKEAGMIIQDEISVQSTYINFRFGFIGENPFILMKHSYGTNSIMNLTEAVLTIIERDYIKYYGFNLVEDVKNLYFMDVSFTNSKGPCERVRVAKGIENPSWESIEVLKFEKMWDALTPTLADELVFFSPNQSLTGYLYVKEIFNQAKRKIQIIDPYFDNIVYQLLNDINSELQIQMLTENIFGDASVVYNKMKKERGKVEIKISKKNHDRFVIIDENKVFLLGGSINSIGDKASMIIPIEASKIKEQIKQHFKNQWNDAIELK
ncbi:phospholipase D-like domain-containing protein [Lysinibacillus sp. NPDC097162]|uniref:phospholipase D-like domain-containing protein n=1 Tax=Lysinibacillus sp. NPDC097162 TaxID=3364140 RepID=UPI00382CFC08